MIFLQDAFDAARALVAEIADQHATDIVMIAMIDHPRAWAFTYNTRAFAEGRDPLASLVGNGPVVVPKSGTPPFLASSARPIAEQLDELSE